MTSASPAEAPSRRERRRREIHERILAAAIELFEHKGFSGTTALEIADTADVAEKTFYNHFPTKQHLIEELAARTLEVTAELLAEARAFPGTTADRLRHFCERTADLADQTSRDFTREVMIELQRVAHLDGLATEQNGRLQSAIRTILDEGLARGDVAPGHDLEFHGELAVAAYLGMMIYWVTLPNYPLRDRLRQLAEELSSTLARPPDEDHR